ncbi:MAG: hypothetical protein CVT77_12600 [Alphaproteobacteria bacterium HGW-Alphaproteobacteria-16]|nr:MAG: hypothetical protein CVT77_12600 [Alphaproteobacteria bacterium HGW-Alphaproteobacteria-16]
MSDPIADTNMGARDGAMSLLAQVAVADSLANRGLATAIDDFFLPEPARLDERSRVALARLLRALIATVEGEIRGHAVRLLRAQDLGELAEALHGAGDAYAPLSDTGLLRDTELMAELIARVRQEGLATGMQAHGHAERDRPSLINRFVQHPDRVLAQGAMAVLIAESRRRSVPDHGPLAQTDLPAELHHRLVWWVAAALRARVVTEGETPAALDRALVEAAQRSLAAHDEGDRLEAASMRLAVAIDARPAEAAELMAEALADRRVTLFAALLAHALGVDYAAARDIALDAPDGRLWVALRALNFPREAVAHIGVALAEADPRLDIEAFADQLDEIMAIEAEEARDALATLRLPADYRAAMLALKGERR